MSLNASGQSPVKRTSAQHEVTRTVSHWLSNGNRFNSKRSLKMPRILTTNETRPASSFSRRNQHSLFFSSAQLSKRIPGCHILFLSSFHFSPWLRRSPMEASIQVSSSCKSVSNVCSSIEMALSPL